MTKILAKNSTATHYAIAWLVYCAIVAKQRRKVLFVNH